MTCRVLVGLLIVSLLHGCAGIPPAPEVRSRVINPSDKDASVLAAWFALRNPKSDPPHTYISVFVHHDGYFEVMAAWLKPQPARSHLPPLPPREIQKHDRGQLSREEMEGMLRLFNQARFQTQADSQMLKPRKIMLEVTPLSGKPYMEEFKGTPDEEIVLRFSPQQGAHKIVSRALSESNSGGEVYDPKGPFGELDSFFYELASRGRKPAPIPFQL